VNESTKNYRESVLGIGNLSGTSIGNFAWYQSWYRNLAKFWYWYITRI